MAKAALTGDGIKRANTFMVPLSLLTLVTDKKHYLYKRDQEDPLDERFVKRIARKGLEGYDPIKVVRDGDQILIAEGRTRYRGIMAANELRVAEGLDPIDLVECKVVKGDESKLVELMVGANVWRKVEDPLSLARSCAQYLALGKSVAEAAELFRVSTQQVRRWDALMGMSVAVQEAVERRAMTMTEALALKDKTKAEQAEAAKAAVEDKKAGKKKARAQPRPSREKLAELVEKLTPAQAQARAAISYALGEIDLAALEKAIGSTL